MTIKVEAAEKRDGVETGKTMKAVVTTGNGGYDKLAYGDAPLPILGAGEVLLQVLAAGVNNTEINTRVGWYSSRVTGDTQAATENMLAGDDGGWNEKTPFPLIQGTDCCGRVCAVASMSDAHFLGARVLVRPCMRRSGFASLECRWMGSDFNGAFAQFVKVPAHEVFVIDSNWSDAELATIPCAYGTAENMLHRARVGRMDHVLVMGASGGVGSAVVQLAKRRGASVTAVAGRAKMAQVRALGADQVIARGDDLRASLGDCAVDVVVDNVGGADFPSVLKVLQRGGRYVSSGAIAGPLVTLDMRDFYLKDVTLIGCTAWDEAVFPNLITYIERQQLRPILAKTFPLENIAAAQREFLEKKHVGNFVLIPPALPA